MYRNLKLVLVILAAASTAYAAQSSPITTPTCICLSQVTNGVIFNRSNSDYKCAECVTPGLAATMPPFDHWLGIAMAILGMVGVAVLF